MKTKQKYGFKKYISKSLPLPTTKNYNNGVLTKGSIVFYISHDSNKVYGKLNEIEEGRRVYCYWERNGLYTSWGWMPKDQVLVETSSGGVPIITLDWDESIGVKPQ